MQYQGGKERIAAQIVHQLESRRVGRPYLEPFMGGASVVSRMSGVRLAGDAHAGLVCLWQKAQEGWIPPTLVTEGQYALLKHRRDEPDALVAFAGFGCSFAGRYFEGYARDKRRTTNWAAPQSASVVRKAAGLRGVELRCCSYSAWNPEGMLIYCDPPYAGTKAYSRVAKFDSAEFWARMRGWAQTNTVLVSEYAAPDFAETVWQKDLAKPLRSSHRATEKLFLVHP